MAGPFVHLKSDVTDEGEHIWTLVPSGASEGLEDIDDVRSVAGLRRRVSGANMLTSLFGSLTDVDSRRSLQTVLLETYFGESARDVLRRSLETPTT
jgi:hypothetical protein